MGETGHFNKFRIKSVICSNDGLHGSGLVDVLENHEGLIIQLVTSGDKFLQFLLVEAIRQVSAKNGVWERLCRGPIIHRDARKPESNRREQILSAWVGFFLSDDSRRPLRNRQPLAQASCMIEARYRLEVNEALCPGTDGGKRWSSTVARTSITLPTTSGVRVAIPEWQPWILSRERKKALLCTEYSEQDPDVPEDD